MKVLIVDDEAYAVSFNESDDLERLRLWNTVFRRSMAQAQSVFLNEKIDRFCATLKCRKGRDWIFLSGSRHIIPGRNAFSLPATTNTLISGRPCSWEAAIIFSNRWIMTS